MRYTLRKVIIEGFRGINNDSDPLSLPIKEGVNSFFGANGQGKSSIFEALQYAITGTIGKLEELQAVDAGQEYYNNLFHPRREACIELILRPNDGSPEFNLKIERNSNGQRSASASGPHLDAEKILAELNQELVLLDYGVFHKFVNGKDLERGKALAELIGLAPISNVRQTLEALCNAGNLRRDLHFDEIDQTIGSLSREQRKVEAEMIEQMQAFAPLTYDTTNVKSFLQAAIDNLKADATIGDILTGTLTDDIFAEIDSRINVSEKNKDQQKLGVTLRKIAELKENQQALSIDSEISSIVQFCDERQQKLAITDGDLLRGVYDTVQIVLESEAWKEPQKCPSCGLDTGFDMLSYIKDKLQKYVEVTAIETSIATLAKNAHLSNIVNRASVALDLPNTVQAQISRLEIGKPNKADIFEIASSVGVLFTACTAKIGQLENERATLEDKLPESVASLVRRIEATRNLRKNDNKHTTLVSEINNQKLQLQEGKAWEGFIREASDLFEKAERKFSQERLDLVQQSFQTYYQRIMGAPPIVPQLHQKGKSQDVRLILKKFYSENNKSALALLSESHRNAVGISLYLSAATLFSGSAQFIILDDVTSSFDSGHQINVLELFRDVANPNLINYLQIVFFSHDPQLQKSLDVISNKDHNWHHYRLTGDPPHGMIFLNKADQVALKTAFDNYLQNGEELAAKPLIRQYLEARLLEIIRSVQIPVPLDLAVRNDSRMMQALINAIEGAVELHSTSTARSIILTQNQQADLGLLSFAAVIANFLSHFDTSGSSVLTPAIMRDAVNKMDQYVSLFQYTCTCSGVPTVRFYKDLWSKHCKC